MAYRVAINGFGRIGRQVLKAAEVQGYGDVFEIVAVNDLSRPDFQAHLLKYDSTYGRFDADIQATEDSLVINGRTVQGVSQRDPSKLPWGELGIDLVIDASGRFTDAKAAQAHIDAGAKKVLITAPGKNVDQTIVLGVNEDTYDPATHHIVSNASCTTNGLAPAAKVVLDNFGIHHGMMTTVHAYTNDQVVLDGSHKDPRRARAAAQNIIPTTTGAARALGTVIPELKGKFDGFALRVPTPTVSIIDFVVQTEKPVTVEAVNDAFKQAAESERMCGILGFSDEPLVSSDYREDSRSSIVDGLSTMVMGDKMVKVVAWYDNEWGYSCRVVDLAALMCKKGFSNGN